MATTLDGLKTYYGNVMRVGANAIPAADLTLLTTLSSQVDAGLLGLDAAQQQLVRQAANTSSVALLAYNFFTGATPTLAGLDYLVSPAGGNTANLNAAYYQSFSLENRYINFAVNLGKLGEGATKFALEYGGLTMGDAVAKAYTEIFGVVPTGQKVVEILSMPVPDGRGGTFNRVNYFASYGGDLFTGNQIGTKAAMVGWLLTEAVKAGVGDYALANNALLADLGPDGTAAFKTNLVQTYSGSPGATVAFTADQSVSPLADAPGLRTTDFNDTVTGPRLGAGQQIRTVGGADSITVSGTASGLIDTGDGFDKVTVKVLGPSTGLVSGVETGTIRLGAGNDVLVVTDHVEWNAVIDGGAGDDTLVAGYSNLTLPFGPNPDIRNVEHLVVTSVDPAFARVTASNIFQDVTSQVNGDLTLNLADNIPVKMQGVSSGRLVVNYTGRTVANPTPGDGRPLRIFAGPEFADLSLDGVSVAPGASTVAVVNLPSALRVHVLSDSTLTSLSNASVDGLSSRIFIDGPGRLTTEIGPMNNVEASFSAGVNITRFGGTGGVGAYLSPHDDRIAVDAGAPPTNSGNVAINLGGGSDTLSLYRAVGAAAPAFANLRVSSGGQLDGVVLVADFVKGVDRIDLGNVATVIVDLNPFVGAAATMTDALANVSPRLAAGATGVFSIQGMTFIYRQDASLGVSTGDGLIQLLGSAAGLTTGTGADADIHYG